MAEPRLTAGEPPETDVAAALALVGSRLDALQDEVRRLRPTPLPPAGDGWADPEGAAVSHEWLVSLDPAPRRRPAAPRLLLEAAFLVATAALAAAAELEPLAIAAVMAAAWIVVALAEWAAARSERRRAEALAAPPPSVPRVAAPDPAWFSPPVEHTVLQGTGPREPDTAVVRLPPRSREEAAGEDTIERPPPETL